MGIVKTIFLDGDKVNKKKCKGPVKNVGKMYPRAQSEKSPVGGAKSLAPLNIININNNMINNIIINIKLFAALL